MDPLEKFKFCPACSSGQFLVKNTKSRKCTECGFVYYFNPSAATACFITDPAGRLLVAVRGKEPAKGTYDLPGGFVDANESGEQAILREIYEETGLIPGKVDYLFSLPNTYPYGGIDVQTLDIFYECRIEDLQRAVAADDVAELIILEPGSVEPGMFGLRSVREAVTRYLGR